MICYLYIRVHENTTAHACTDTMEIRYTRRSRHRRLRRELESGTENLCAQQTGIEALIKSPDGCEFFCQTNLDRAKDLNRADFFVNCVFFLEIFLIQ